MGFSSLFKSISWVEKFRRWLEWGPREQPVLEQHSRTHITSWEWVLDTGCCCHGDWLWEGGTILKRYFRSPERKETYLASQLFNYIGKHNFRWHLKLFTYICLIMYYQREKCECCWQPWKPWQNLTIFAFLPLPSPTMKREKNGNWRLIRYKPERNRNCYYKRELFWCSILFVHSLSLQAPEAQWTMEIVHMPFIYIISTSTNRTNN